MLRRLLCALACAGALAAGAARAGDDKPAEVFVPEGTDTSRPLTREGTKDLMWIAVVVSDDLPVYRHPSDDRPLTPAAAERLKFGEACYVVAVQRLPRRRYLLAKFDANTVQFQRLVGWVDPDWVLDEDALTVARARQYVRSRIVAGDPRRAWVEKMLPETEAAGADRIVLKAWSHPERGNRVFRKPVPAEEREAATARGEGEPIQTFAFFYCLKLVVHARNVYLLLGHHADFALYDKGSDSFRDETLGWLSLDDAILWPHREGVLPDMSQVNCLDRLRREARLRLYSSPEQARAAVLGLERDAAGRPVTPVWQEPEAKPDERAAAAPPGASGWAVLGRTKVPGSSTSLLHLGVPSGLEGTAGAIDLRDVEKDKKDILSATLQMRTLELCILLDSTGSMSGVYGDVKEAIRALVDDLRKSEAAQPALNRVILRVGVVCFWDYGDPKLTEPADGHPEESPGYFDVTSPDGWAKFEKYMDERKSGGGGDEPEQHLEAIHVATDMFFRHGPGSFHLPGAQTVCVLFSDAPSHVKDDGSPARFTLDDSLAKLGPVGRAGRQMARVMFNPVFVKEGPDHSSPLFHEQMGPLAEKTGGKTFTMEAYGSEEQRRKVPAALKDHLRNVIEAERALMIRKRHELARSFTRRSTKDGTPVPEFEAKLAEWQMTEIFSPAQLKAMRERLSQTGFAIVYGPDRLPGDAAPRLRLRVLLTDREMVKVLGACSELGDQLVKELRKVRLPRDKVDAIYKRLVITVMKHVMGDGDDVNDRQMRRWERMPLEDIQKELSSLPILFGVLTGEGPRTLADAHDLVKKLNDRTRVLERIVYQGEKEKRWVPGGAAAGQLHVWVDPDTELP